MNKVLHGDSLEVLKTIDAESVDLLCTDPPYGYSFMGKSWDKTLPDIGIFKECFRVLKPGAFAFVMSAPRSDVCWRMTAMLEECGFDIGFTPVYHTYASGFPKAQNVHKKLTKDQEARKHEVQELWRAIIHSATPDEQSVVRPSLSEVLEDLEQGEQHEISSKDTEGEEIQVSERQRQSFMEGWADLSAKKGELFKCKVCSLPLGLYLNGAKRWICYGTQNRAGDVSWTLIDEDGGCSSYKSQLHGQQTRKSNALCEQCGTQTIRTLSGSFSGFQPKPAVEVVIVAMKPLSEKTFVDQALKNGKGITWLDDCRVPTGEPLQRMISDNAAWRKVEGRTDITYDPKLRGRDGGRFPANLLVESEALNGHSKYFDLDEWSKTLPFLIVPKASKREKNEGLEHLPDTNANREGAALTHAEGRTASTKNAHPTVKPLKLMTYLITLGSRPGEVVLDPFLGSGTTALAAKQLGRQYIGVEREKEYIEIAEARLISITPSLI